MIPEGGAGGTDRLPGSYVFGNHREPYRDAGAWGRFIVHDPCRETTTSLAPLPGSTRGCPSGNRLLRTGLITVPAVLLAAFGFAWRRRRR